MKRIASMTEGLASAYDKENSLHKLSGREAKSGIKIKLIRLKIQKTGTFFSTEVPVCGNI